MTEIAVSHVFKSFGGNMVLRDLSLEVFSGEKVALVGGNGAGKTTLLRIISGSETCDSGTVATASGRRLGLLSQLPVFPGEYTALDVLRGAFEPIIAMKQKLEELERAMMRGHTPSQLKEYGQLAHHFELRGGFDLETPLLRVCRGLRIDDTLLSRRFSELSGGEQTRINLARLILSDADVLLLDEPTNHLDMKNVEWLEGYVSRSKSTFIIVSHDRYFLDNATGRVIELRGGKAESYSGNYSFYKASRAQRLETQTRAYEREQREKKRLADTARRMHDYAGKSAKLHKRAFAIEKRIARVGDAERPEYEKTLRARFQADGFRADDVLRLSNLSCGFGASLFDGVSLAVSAGERIGILGDNGSGKTTLLRTIVGEHKPTSGFSRTGKSVKVSYLPQMVVFPHPERTLLEELQYGQNEATQKARDRLASFHFTGEEVFWRVGELSGGEKSRLKLCMLMKDKVNLLLLDEPTNHLDIPSREWMEEAVAGFHETLVFVSHDRYFTARFATRLWILENGGITDFPGTFAEYRASLSAAPPKPEAPAPSPAPASAPPTLRQAGRGKARRILDARRRSVEAAIDKTESRLRDIESEMEKNASDAEILQTLFEEKNSLQAKRDILYEQWDDGGV